MVSVAAAAEVLDAVCLKGWERVEDEEEEDKVASLKFSKLSRLSLIEVMVEICEDLDIRDSDLLSIVGMGVMGGQLLLELLEVMAADVAAACCVAVMGGVEGAEFGGVGVYGATPLTALSLSSMHVISGNLWSLIPQWTFRCLFIKSLNFQIEKIQKNIFFWSEHNVRIQI